MDLGTYFGFSQTINFFFGFRSLTMNVSATLPNIIHFGYIHVQGVHKVRVHFKKFITLFLFVIEIICKNV